MAMLVYSLQECSRFCFLFLDSSLHGGNAGHHPMMAHVSGETMKKQLPNL